MLEIQDASIERFVACWGEYVTNWLHIRWLLPSYVAFQVTYLAGRAVTLAPVSTWRAGRIGGGTAVYSFEGLKHEHQTVLEVGPESGDGRRLIVIWPGAPEGPADASSFREGLYERPLARMKAHGMPFVDALILNLAERTPGVQGLVTWNARHFRGKSRLPAFTPQEHLQS